MQSPTIRLTRRIDLAYEPASGRLGRPDVGAPPLERRPLRLWITLAGPIDAATGLLVNVSDIQAAFARGLDAQPHVGPHPAAIASWARSVVRNDLRPHRLVQAILDLTERLVIRYRYGEKDMVELTCRFTLAASHRLWNPDWNEAQNRGAYGKCSNPRGHGHNYILEVTIRGKPDPETGLVIDPARLEAVVDREILERYDHKHLNEDTPEFARLVPTVENMVQVFWQRLAGRFAPAQLARVAVWETEKTFAEYCGPEAGPLRYSDSV